MKTYKRSETTRLINWWFRTPTELGLGRSERQILTTRPCFDATQDSPDDAELSRHAVFRLARSVPEGSDPAMSASTVEPAHS